MPRPRMNQTIRQSTGAENYERFSDLVTLLSGIIYYLCKRKPLCNVGNRSEHIRILQYFHHHIYWCDDGASCLHCHCQSQSPIKQMAREIRILLWNLYCHYNDTYLLFPLLILLSCLVLDFEQFYDCLLKICRRICL